MRFIGLGKNYFFRKELQDGRHREAVTVPGFAWQEIGEEFAGTEFGDRAGWGAVLESRRKQGHRCFGWVTEQGVLAAVFWVSRPEAAAMQVPLAYELTFVIRRGQAYLWDCYTAPEFRGRGLFRAGLLACLADASQQASEAVIFANWHNDASLRGIRGAGFDPFFSLWIARLGRFSIPIRGFALRSRLLGERVFDILGKFQTV